LNSWRLDSGSASGIFVLLDCAMTSGPDEVITRRSRVECRKEIPWCLWCLSRPEIAAIYAEQLKELQNLRP
jgi:hypothetical protein